MTFDASDNPTPSLSQEIIRTAVYGILSFNPSKPAKKVEMSAVQAAATFGRPRALPVPPEQTTVAEASFFDKVRTHLAQKEMQSEGKVRTRTEGKP